MAIVTMKRMSLLAMQADKDKIFDALIRSNAVQLKRTEDIACCTVANVSLSVEQLLEKINRAEDAIAFLAEETGVFNAENKNVESVAEAKIPKNPFSHPLTEIDYDYFLGFGKNAENVEKSLDTLSALRNMLVEQEAALAQNRAEYNKYLLYKDLPHPTTWYQGTENAVVQLCTMPASEWANALALAREFPLVELDKISETSTTAVVGVVVHKTQTEFFEKASALGLVKSSIYCDILPVLQLKKLDVEAEKIQRQIFLIKRQMVGFDGDVPEWKIYIDYLNLCVKKATADGDLQHTNATFVLEGYYPAEQEENVCRAVEQISDCVVFCFQDIGEEEFAPTLVKNNPIVRQFEAVTNMYTPPSYHEIDPNPVMSVFYFVIFGFMVADIGYGALLVAAGLFAALAIKQTTGLKTLLQLFGICGISAIAVGALFGSCFSYSLYQGIIPDPSQYPMVMIILSLLVGLVHVIAGVGCKMAVKVKHKQYAAACLADFPWILVFGGLVLAIWNAAVGMAGYDPYNVLILPDIVAKVGLYVCLGSLAVALVFAGIGTKGVKGKVVKSFGGLYGVINYFSDVMSYIRIFGLMLSSALIGSVVNMLGGMVASGGGFGYVLAAVVLVFAHLFNLVMGCLSVYIHNGRLQYVEFFGKFYTGDGQLFVPFGSDTKYILVRSFDK